MSPTWQSENPPAESGFGWAGWLRVVARGVPVAVVMFGGLGLLLLLRLPERLLFGPARPLSPYVTQAVCKLSLRLIGLGYRVRGTPLRQRGAVVANHSSWLDILVLNAGQRIYFVAKSEVAAWPGIGWLARASGTVFIRRTVRDAKAQQDLFEARLGAAHMLLFFPEGTSTDGLRVLPFKPTLFQAFFAPDLRQSLYIQPATVVYRPPEGADARFYGWWGDMDFGPHFLKVLAARRNGSVEVILHAPVPVARFSDRKALARYCETTVRSAHHPPT